MRKIWQIIIIMMVFLGLMGVGVIYKISDVKAQGTITDGVPSHTDGVPSQGEKNPDYTGETKSTSKTWFKNTQEIYEKNVFGGDPNETTGDRHQYWTSENTLKFFSSAVSPTKEGQEAARAAGIITPQGAVPFLAGGISKMVGSPVVNTSYYIASIIDDAGFGIVQPAYAQSGMGWTTLQPVMEVWKAFRNLAYMVFIFVFIVIGFMIMFRSKLGGQALVTIQTALPQIVVTLLLITFSYAIAALMIDLIYLLIYIIISIFDTVGLIDDINATKTAIFSGDVVDIVKQLIIRSDGTTVVATVADQIGSIVNSFIDGAIGGFLDNTAEALVRFIFSIALLFMVFKLFIKLLQAYVGMIFSIIFGPIILLTNAIPGKNSFGSWIKGLLANVLVFPVTAIMFIVGSALTNSNSFGTDPNFVDPAQMSGGGLALPFIGGGMNSGALTTIIGFGVIMFIPQVAEMLQKALGAEGGIAGAMSPIMENVQKGYGIMQAPGKMIGAFAAPAVGGVVSAATTEWWRGRKGRVPTEVPGTTGPDAQGTSGTGTGGPSTTSMVVPPSTSGAVRVNNPPPQS